MLCPPNIVPNVSHLGGVRAQHVLVDLGAPAGAGGKHELAVLDRIGPSQEPPLPWHLIDIELHEAQLTPGFRGLTVHWNADLRNDQRSAAGRSLRRSALNLLQDPVIFHDCIGERSLLAGVSVGLV
jgi:hypothetical protein